jgi:hypothetical protein
MPRFLVSLSCLSNRQHSVSCDVGATAVHLIQIVVFSARIFQNINSPVMCTMKTWCRIFHQLYEYLLRVTLCYTLQRFSLGSTVSFSILSDSVTRNVAIDWLTHRLRIRGVFVLNSIWRTSYWWLYFLLLIKYKCSNFFNFYCRTMHFDNVQKFFHQQIHTLLNI